VSARRFLVLQGPNLDRLGLREVSTYGTTTLPELTERLDTLAAELGCELQHFQSALEGELVGRVHRAVDEGVEAAIVNAAAYTHTSIALRDALLAGPLPFVEVHLSNVHAREPFRHRSLLADVAIGVITGLGPASYELALRALVGRSPSG
jgi:3-dehydroquinate dehydratase-2